jgi:hypothetical protein
MREKTSGRESRRKVHLHNVLRQFQRTSDYAHYARLRIFARPSVADKQKFLNCQRASQTAGRQETAFCAAQKLAVGALETSPGVVACPS